MPFKTIWTDEKLKNEASKYKTRQDFRKGSSSAYVIARNKGDDYCDKLFSHMSPSSSKKKWTVDSLCELALSYSDRKSFRKDHNGANKAGQQLGVLHLMYAHMKRAGGFDITKPAIMYYLSINNGLAYKIGITNFSVEIRFKLCDLKNITVLKTWEFDTGDKAIKEELRIKKEFLYARWTGDDLLTNGNTELFNSDVLQLDI